MKNVTKFSAIYCSGLIVPKQATVVALGMLFEKVYLPNNIEYAVEFAKRFRINGDSGRYKSINIESDDPTAGDPLTALAPLERETALKYIDWAVACAQRNQALFGPVIESALFENNSPMEAKLIRQGAIGELNTYEVSMSPMQLTGEDEGHLAKMISSGYVPVVGSVPWGRPIGGVKSQNAAAKELAAMLAIHSVEMLFPATIDAPAELVLEARDKLRDQLPLFWSTMLKLTSDLKLAIKDCQSHEELSNVARDIVDTQVRPALIDLNHKIELERKQWFYKIFGGFFQGLKVVAANPPMTPEQLIRSSLMLGADTIANTAAQMHKVDIMKREAGLTYLLDLGTMLEKPRV